MGRDLAAILLLENLTGAARERRPGLVPLRKPRCISPPSSPPASSAPPGVRLSTEGEVRAALLLPAAAGGICRSFGLLQRGFLAFRLSFRDEKSRMGSRGVFAKGWEQFEAGWWFLAKLCSGTDSAGKATPAPHLRLCERCNQIIPNFFILGNKYAHNLKPPKGWLCVTYRF